MSRFEQKRVALANGIHLDVVDEGPTDAPALIFLHGFPESHRTWRHQMRTVYVYFDIDQKGAAPHDAQRLRELVAES